MTQCSMWHVFVLQFLVGWRQKSLGPCLGSYWSRSLHCNPVHWPLAWILSTKPRSFNPSFCAKKALWAKLGRGGELASDLNSDLVAALEGYTASCDFPSCLYYNELLALNPAAKVVLTARDADKWYESATSTNWAIPRVARRLWLLHPIAQRFVREGDDMILRRAIGGQQHIDDRQHCIQAYERHVEDVKRHVPAEQLLVFDVKQGWEPLCAFLGKPVPTTPFPHVNDAAQFKLTLERLVLVDTVLSVAVASILVGSFAYFVQRLAVL